MTKNATMPITIPAISPPLSRGGGFVVVGKNGLTVKPVYPAFSSACRLFCNQET